jgi:lipopolysaccharide transport system ATP-binding protein
MQPHAISSDSEPVPGSISLHGVSKKYHIYNTPSDRLKEALSPRRKKRYQEFWALRDVNLEVAPGSAWGIIGRNGAGKSTLMQLIAGTVTPAEGDVRVGGRIAAMLELGTGFNPEYTGRENVFLSAAIAGIPRAHMEKRFDDIAAFADIGDFINQPVKTYSTGMFARLAFAVAVCTDPDILMVDEMLSVGDADFQQRCILRVRKLREKGVTLLLCSHSMDTIKSTCSNVLLLEGGRVHFAGNAMEGTDLYLQMVRDRMNQRNLHELADKLGTITERVSAGASARYGTGHVRIENVRLLDSNGQSAGAVAFGDKLVLEVEYKSSASIDGLSVSFLVRDGTGIDLFGTTTFDEAVPLPRAEPGQTGMVRFEFMNPLRAGSYGVCVAVTRNTRVDLTDNVVLDQIDNAVAFQSLNQNGRPVWYKMHVPIQISVPATSADSTSAVQFSASPGR